MKSPTLPFAAAPVSLTSPTFPAAATRASLIAAQVTDLVEAAEFGWNQAVSTVHESLIGERLYSERSVLDVQVAAISSEVAKVAQLRDAVGQALITLNVVLQSMPAAGALREVHQNLALAEANFSGGRA